MKIVLDTNIFISAWLWRGLPNELLKLAKNQQLIICSSEVLLKELETTFGYQKLQKKMQALNYTVEQLMLGTRELVQVYPIISVSCPELRDPDDNIVLATACAAQADTIITGDKDLLSLGRFSNIPILKVQDFLKSYRKKQTNP